MKLKMIALTIFFFLISVPVFSAGELTIRPLIIENKESIRIYSKGGILLSKDIDLPEFLSIAHDKDFLTLSGKRLNKRRLNFRSKTNAPILVDEILGGNYITVFLGSNGISVIGQLSLEKYVSGIVEGEIGSSWPTEALKAQAVAARTHAYYLMNKRSGKDYDIKSSDQLYKKGIRIYPKIKEAVNLTRGEILTHNGKVIKARFSTSCGGRTEVSRHVWGVKDISVIKEDPYCKNSPHNQWRLAFSSSEITKILKKYGFNPGRIDKIQPISFKKSGRIAAVSIHGTGQTISLTGNDLRRYIGFGRLKSTKFTLKKKGDRFIFSGSGYGHGVGMCQWGAMGMAKKGFSYKEILNFYYPRAEITEIY